MTVKELKEILGKLDDKAEVVISNGIEFYMPGSGFSVAGISATGEFYKLKWSDGHKRYDIEGQE